MVEGLAGLVGADFAANRSSGGGAFSVFSSEEGLLFGAGSSNDVLDLWSLLFLRECFCFFDEVLKNFVLVELLRFFT